MALAARTEAWTLRRERVTYNATSAMLTGWKKTDELAFLNDVSCVPLQQALRHLQTAFTNFFAETGPVSDVQVEEAVAAVGGVHGQRVPVARRPADPRQDV